MNETEKDAERLANALESALLCVEDQVNLYAPEQCTASRVKEARARHAECGTLWYYAENIKRCRAALAAHAAARKKRRKR